MQHTPGKQTALKAFTAIIGPVSPGLAITKSDHTDAIKMGGFQRLLIPVKREELYTDLEARIRYLHSFVDFSSRKCTHSIHVPGQQTSDVPQETSRP